MKSRVKGAVLALVSWLHTLSYFSLAVLSFPSSALADGGEGGAWYAGGTAMAVTMVVSVAVTFGYVIAGSGFGIAVLEGLASVIHIVEAKCRSSKAVRPDAKSDSSDDEELGARPPGALTGARDADLPSATPAPTGNVDAVGNVEDDVASPSPARQRQDVAPLPVASV